MTMLDDGTAHETPKGVMSTVLKTSGRGATAGNAGFTICVCEEENDPNAGGGPKKDVVLFANAPVGTADI
jgi:hypothetical protein